jgi:CubicO group peptidase (beta-lactamase class C family)
MRRAIYSLINIVVSLTSSFLTLFNKQTQQNLWQRLRSITFLIIVIFLMPDCGSQAKKNNLAGSNAADTAIIDLPKPRPISIAETQKLHNACQAWFDSVLLPKGFNGGIIVARGDNVVFEKYNGTAHIPGNDVITASTPMHIASVSKTFTAMAVLKLWQDGKLNIDDDLNKYIPAFNYPGVTIRSLLNHRSGLPNYTHFLENMGWDKNKIITNEEILQFLIANKPAMENVAPPDTHFTYCNTNYALLAVLVEKITGKKFPAFLAETFFIPLQMKNTFVCKKEDSLKITPSYDWKGRPMTLNFLDAVYGDKNIYTTPHDLLIWDQALLSNKIFKPETLEQAYTPYSNEKPGIRNYGLGWRMNIYPDGKKMIYHNGWWHGSNASFIRLIKEDATIIVIGNKFTRAVYGAKILCNLFGDYYTGEEEDENDNQKQINTLIGLDVHDTATSKKLLKKENKAQQFFKDRNKLNTH